MGYLEDERARAQLEAENRPAWPVIKAAAEDAAGYLNRPLFGPAPEPPGPDAGLPTPGAGYIKGTPTNPTVAVSPPAERAVPEAVRASMYKPGQAALTQPGPIGGYGNEGRSSAFSKAGIQGQAERVGNAVAGYGGLDEGAGFALARQAAAGSPPQGLPPGVTQLRMDVPADGPKHLLGPGLNGAEMPSRIGAYSPAPGEAAGQRAWGNAAGDGPVIRTIGNGITREDELNIRHHGGPLAVLAANQAANMMPLQREALAANTGKTQAETNKILQDPGFEDRRTGAIEQEMRNRLALGQGELGVKGAELGLKERLGMAGLGQEERKISILGSEAKAKIAGMELDQKKQRDFSDMASALAAATDPVQQETIRQNMYAFLGVRDNKDLDIKVIAPQKATDNAGNTTVSPGYVVVTGKDGKPNIIPLGGHEAAVAPPKEAIAYLKKNPGTAADFEAKFKLPPGGHKQYLQ